MQRNEVVDESLWKALELVTQSVGKRVEKHGRGAFAGPHEALGVLTEEYWELIEAIKGNDPYRVAEEWVDNAVTCVFALASMMAASPVTVDENDGEDHADDRSQYTNVEDAAERARKLMIDRAQQSNIVIADKI